MTRLAMPEGVATIYGMKKTTVYLEEATLRAIEAMARTSGRSQAELIREALRTYVEQRPRPSLRCVGAGEGPEDLAERADEYLGAGFGD